MDKDVFLDTAARGAIPPLFREMPYKPPQDVYSVLRSKNSLLLHSAKGPPSIARYSFIGWDPYIIITADERYTEIESSYGRAVFSKRPLVKLKELLSAYNQQPIDTLPPFQGGAAGLLSYDFVRYIENIPKIAKDDLQLPYLHFMLFDKVISFDHKERRAWIVICPGVRDTRVGNNPIEIDWGVEYDRCSDILDEIFARLNKIDGNATIDLRRFFTKGDIDIVHAMTKAEYMEMVRRGLEYIRAGDIFQTNLSQRLQAAIGNVSSWDIYMRLLLINPSPFACYIDFGDYQIVSSSPERLIRQVRGDKGGQGRLYTRPIAGTRPRGHDMQSDHAMRSELLLNEKERAEHIMLIDLERNDLGRVCNYGSVHVDELMITEDYSHVIHIVSNVTGELAAGMDCFRTIRAVFPGGTITGVPKVRCMEIIEELEPTRRGPYTGSAGYISYNGEMDLNIVIRTFLIKDGMAYIQAGAGIVADSAAEREYDETLKKAEALIKTLNSK